MSNSVEKSKLSLDTFHKGQELAGNNIQEALVCFREVLKQAQEGGGDITIVGEDWEQYILGTISYLKSDMADLEKNFNAISNKERKEIIGRFIAGLGKRERPDYGQDY